MVLREIISKIANTYSGGTPSDDSRLPPRQVYSAIKSARSRALADALKEGQVSEFNYTTLPCLEVEEIDAYECDCIPIEGCTFYRSKCDLYGVIREHDKDVKSVTAIDQTHPNSIIFSKTSWERLRDSNFDKYTSKHDKYFIRNNKLYLVTAKRVKVVTVKGLFDDPISIKRDCGCGDLDCTSNLDLHIELDQKYIIKMLPLIRMELMQMGVEDVSNNARNSKPEESK
jgi:hypothetical protein